MKKVIPLLLGIFVLLWTACGEDSNQSTSAESDAAPAASSSDAPESAAPKVSPTANLAICLWNQAGLRSAPGRGKDAEWITAINFGEVVSLTGEEQTIEGNDRTYLEMELSDGKTGWSNGYLFAVDAMRAAALQPVELYKRPDLTTYSGDKFEPGEIFAVMQGDRDDWVEVYGKERKKKGWMRNNGAAFSTDEIDVTVAILIDRATAEKDPRKREAAFTDIAENSAFSSSPMLKLVDEQLSNIATIPDLPANQLMIMASNLNVRSEPDNEADNVVFQLSEGDICNILERGDLVQIREMEDYWYKVSSNGQEGWIFGYFTSKRLAE